MTDEEIMGRAKRVEGVFRLEADRIGDRRAREIVSAFRDIAWNVESGEYHRSALFRYAVSNLEGLGFDTSDVDTEERPCSRSVTGAAENAIGDTAYLYTFILGQRGASPRRKCLFAVVDKADDLMRAIGHPAYDIGMRTRRFHDAVSNYIMRFPCDEPSDEGGEDWSACIMQEMIASYPQTSRWPEIVGDVESVTLGTGSGKVTWTFCEPSRELPKRVIFSPPATIAFWGDGTKTVAKCSKDDEFSEYVGLLVCIAKRKLKLPRRGTFEDAMARLIGRAERPRATARAASR